MRHHLRLVFHLLTLAVVVLCVCVPSGYANAGSPAGGEAAVGIDAQGAIERMQINEAYQVIASQAVNDLVNHYWSNEKQAIRTTWNGYPEGYDDIPTPDPRGTVWPRGCFLMPALRMAQLNDDQALLELCVAEWENIKGIFTVRELSVPKPIVNTSVDDCGWNALVYLDIYRAIGDETALEIAKTLITNVFEKWYDDDWGGFSLWYRDQRDFKSLYQCGVLLACFELSEITGDESFRMLAKTCYDTLENLLLRDDGIYFCDYNQDGPIGKERPNDIREAGSVSFLAGNMAMGVLHARLYRLTGDEMYLLRALRTVQGVKSVLSVHGGVFLNERDAWANGTYFPEWAEEVLSLPGITEDDKTMMYNTAASVWMNARTEDGFYGGSWSGPADGDRSTWVRVGSRPQQIMTSGSTVLTLVGAAVLEKQEAER